MFFKAISLVFWVVIFLKIVQQPMQASDSINDMRLFYSVEERALLENSKAIVNVSQNSGEAMPPMIGPELDMDMRSADFDLSSSVDTAIEFNGMVKSDQTPVAIINDLPCSALSMHEAGSLYRINCRHIVTEKYQLSLNAETARVNIYLDNVWLATLEVGGAF